MRSILTEFYGGEEQVKKHFGKTNPTVSERTEYHSKLWKEFGKESEIHLPNLTIDEILNIRREYGPFNVVSKNKKLRFRYTDDATYVKLLYGG